MSNLLPKETLQAVRNAHRARFILVGSIVAMVCAVIAFLALVPTYAIVRGERTTAEDQTDVSSLEASTDREEVTRARDLVKELSPVATSTNSISSLLDGVLSVRPAGIVITHINVRRGNPGEIVLSGTAPSRNEINAYREALSKDSHFDSVSVPVPIGILTGLGAGAFNATLVGTF